MAFADISYFGDSEGYDSAPAWQGRVTSASQLDQFNWGAGRKFSFADTMGGRSSGDMNRMIEDALKRRERKDKLREAMGGESTLLKDFNKKDNTNNGVSVGITGPNDMRPNDIGFDVRGATANSQFPFISRIAYDTQREELVQFTRNERISGMGRVVGVEAEVMTPITKLHRPGFFFSLEKDEGSGQLMIKNCKVFLGCLGEYIECDDVEVKKGNSDTYYAHIDFTQEYKSPILTIDTEYRENTQFGGGVFTFPLYEFDKGVVVRGNPPMIILPTFTWFFTK